MSSKAENYHRNSNEQGNSSNDLDYFITSDTPIEHVYNVLKTQNMSEKEIDAMVDKIKEIRQHTRKVVKKFLNKINTTYGHLDIPELIQKGMKHAEKYGLSEAQKKVFKDHVLKGDIHNHYTYQNELRYGKMAKFLGFDSMRGQMIKIGSSDMSKMNELYMLYDTTKHIHADVKNQIFNYRDCAPEAITGAYDRTKHNVGVSIHPVLAALFFPKVEYIERRMLMTNIARMVLSRAQAYLPRGKANFHLNLNLAPGELDAEFELAHDIAHDPNALAYFEDDSPIDNIIKRFKCQIELYKCVLNLRQGRYYATSYEESDGIAGFIRVINSYDWTFFDSPDLYHVQDEGTVLRKLLAVFSCRPTFTQLSSFSQRYGLGHTPITGLAKTVFVNIPIVNIKLPIDLIGNQVHTISLARALTQTDYFIEHKIVVPKNKSVIYSNQVAFFYANRRYPSVNFTSLNCTMRYVSLPTSFINTTTINRSLLNFDNRFRIGRDWFDLRSVVLLQRPPISGVDVAIGCSAAVVVGNNSPSNLLQGAGNSYIHYNPSIASIQYLDGNQPQGQSQYVANTPVTYIDETTNDPNSIGFRNEAQERGTIFFYVKDTRSFNNY